MAATDHFLGDIPYWVEKNKEMGKSYMLTSRPPSFMKKHEEEYKNLGYQIAEIYPGFYKITW